MRKYYVCWTEVSQHDCEVLAESRDDAIEKALSKVENTNNYIEKMNVEVSCSAIGKLIDRGYDIQKSYNKLPLLSKIKYWIKN